MLVLFLYLPATYISATEKWILFFKGKKKIILLSILKEFTLLARQFFNVILNKH